MNARWTAVLHRTARGAAVAVTLIGALCLSGWVFSVRALQDLFGAGVTMKANTAIASTAAGISLLFLESAHPARRLTGKVLAGVVFLLGFLTLIQHVSGHNLGIDQLLFREPPGEVATVSPNRMGPPASVAFCLVGVSLLIWGTGSLASQRVANGLTCVVLFIAAFSIIGYLYGVQAFFGIAQYSGIAPQTAFMFLALGVGILASGSEGLVWLLASDNSGGALARRFLLPAVLLPVVLSWLQLQGRIANYYEVGFGSAALALSFIVIFTLLIVGNSRELGERDAELARHQDQLEDLVAQRTAALESSQAQLRRSERLAAIGTLAAGVAHEINNPLNAILMTAEFSRQCPQEMNAPEALDQIIQETQRCGKIVRNVLRFARHEEAPRSQEDLSAIVRRAVELTKSYVSTEGVDFSLALWPTPCCVHVNALQIEQVLINLLKNAVETGHRPLLITLSTQQEANGAVLRVSDNGPGIDPAQLNQIFDPFFSTKIHRGGTGLGLTLSHSIIVDHGGTIVASSPPGEGTTFTITLPTNSSAV